MRPAFPLVFLVIFSLSGIFAQSAKPVPQKPKRQDCTFRINAARVWTDTGLELERGDRVHIHGSDIDCGGPYPEEKFHLPLPSAPGGALLAKLQPEATPVLATPGATFSIIAPSHLYLGVNGWQCSGTIPARVHVDWGQR